jgi:hypothetical protein
LDTARLQTRARNIRFSSTVSETFLIQGSLSDRLVQAAQDYWKRRGLTIKSLMRPEPGSDNPRVVEFVAEGGTIWTTDFDSYKKRVTVNLSENERETEVLVHITLPGGVLSVEDREKAANLIESLYEAMKAFES